MKPNNELRLYARGKAVSLWLVAEAYGVHENTLLMRMRTKFTEEQAIEFKRIVDSLASEE